MHQKIPGQRGGAAFGASDVSGCRVLRNKNGGVYLFVLVVMLSVTMLVSAALAVTAASRRITARYGEFSSLFDLAVAANEQALFDLQNTLDIQGVNFDAAAQARVSTSYFTSVITTADHSEVIDTFQIVTTVAPQEARFRVFSTVSRVFEDVLIETVPATVTAYIVFLDVDTLKMVQSRRIFS